jgi:hypothetical protein
MPPPPVSATPPPPDDLFGGKIITVIRNNENGNIHIDKVPTRCPFCHRDTRAGYMVGYARNDEWVDILFNCVLPDCNRYFMAYYKRNLISGSYELAHVAFGEPERWAFNEVINRVSPRFSEIYGQAGFAEQHSLSDICGMGYRKALEFLIKDYLASIRPDKEGEIRSTMLMSCIKSYMPEGRAKEMAIRATWLGNDESHYTRIWEGNDLQDLKTLIILTVHWIEVEADTARYQASMNR